MGSARCSAPPPGGPRRAANELRVREEAGFRFTEPEAESFRCAGIRSAGIEAELAAATMAMQANISQVMECSLSLDSLEAQSSAMSKEAAMFRKSAKRSTLGGIASAVGGAASAVGAMFARPLRLSAVSAESADACERSTKGGMALGRPRGAGAPPPPIVAAASLARRSPEACKSDLEGTSLTHAAVEETASGAAAPAELSLAALLRLARADGSFDGAAALLRVDAQVLGVDPRAANTALALGALRTRFAKDSATWALVAKKAEAWLRGCGLLGGTSPEDLLAAAAALLEKDRAPPAPSDVAAFEAKQLAELQNLLA